MRPFLSLLACAFFLGIHCGIDKYERKLATFPTSNGGNIEIFYVDMGATTKEVIQVRSVDKFDDETVLHSFEYNVLRHARLAGQLLIVELSDSNSTHVDTARIKISR